MLKRCILLFLKDFYIKISLVFFLVSFMVYINSFKETTNLIFLVDTDNIVLKTSDLLLHYYSNLFSYSFSISNVSFEFFILLILFGSFIIYLISFVMFFYKKNIFLTMKSELYYNFSILILSLIFFVTFNLIDLVNFNENISFELLNKSIFFENIVIKKLEGKLWLTIIILFLGISSLILSKLSVLKTSVSTLFSIFVLSSILGSISILASQDWLLLYLAIELMTISFFFLIVIQKNLRSIEAGIKYFLISAFSGFLLLFGISYLYLIFGILDFTILEYFLCSSKFFSPENLNYEIVPNNIFLPIVEKGLLLILVSLSIKLGAAPFHMWVPDVYEGSPSFSTLFLILIPKIPLFSIIIYLMYNIFVNFIEIFQVYFFVIGIFSVLLGSIGAIKQKKIKRILAYSSVADTGFLYLGLSVGTIYGLQSVLFYLILYLLFSLIIWSIILYFESQMSTLYQITITNFLSSKTTIGFIFIVLIGTLLGLPPFIGFWSKWFVLLGAVKANLYFGLLFFVLGSLLSSFYYLRLLKITFFEEKTNNINWLSVKDIDLIFFWYLSVLTFLVLLFSIDPSFILLLSQKIILTLIF